MNEQPKRKRPILVWVISIFYVLSAGWTLLSFYLVLSGIVPLAPEQKAYFDSLTSADLALTILLWVASMTGTISLFLLRRLAFYLLTAALALNILMSIWHALSKGWMAALGGPGAVGMFIGMGIAAAICFYSWRLLKSEILR